MLKARTIVYAVVVSLFIYIFLGSFLALRYYNSRLLVKQRVSLELENLCSSSLLVYHNSPDIVRFGSTSKVSVFDDKTSDTELSKVRWGAYELVNAKGIKSGFSKSILQLLGTSPIGHNAIYLSDKNVYLTAKGSTKIHGVIQVPGGLIKRDNFFGKIQAIDSIRYSDKKMPEISLSLASFIKTELKGPLSFEKDYQLEYDIPQERTVSFFDSTRYYYSEGKVVLSDVNLSGKIIVRSASMVVIEADSKLNDIIVTAPQIIVEGGFEGSLQLFADSTLNIGTNCVFKYPSFIALNNKSNSNLHIASGTSIAGGLLLISSDRIANNTSSIIIERDTDVYGLVYSNNRVVLKGDIYGSIYTKYIASKEKGSSKRNTIENVIINPYLLRDEFVYPVLFDNVKRKEILSTHSVLTSII